jgi:hypothetical protein
MRYEKFISIFAILVVSFVFGLPSVFAKRAKAQAPEIAKGEMAVVMHNQWVRIVNLVPIARGNREWNYGDTCEIQKSGTARVLGVSDSRVLLLYERVREDASMLGCASGAMFFAPKREFLQMKSEREKQLAAERVEKELVRKILKAE